MKRSLTESASEQPAKRRKVKHEMYQKWVRQYDREYQTVMWLHCETGIEGGVKLVTKLKCRVCTKYRDRIIGRKNFNDKWISGAGSVRTTLIRHFWKRWSTEYITHIGRFTKWHHPSRNICVGDLVILREDSAISTKWPLARVIKVHPGKDNLVCVATVKMNTGLYTRPVTKLALLLPSESENMD